MCWNSLASRCIWYSIGGKDLRKKVSLPELWNGLVCRAYFGCNGLPSSITAASPSNLFWLSEGFFSQPLKMEVALASLLYKWVAAGGLFQVIYYAIYNMYIYLFIILYYIDSVHATRTHTQIYIYIHGYAYIYIHSYSTLRTHMYIYIHTRYI
jgi:hypothetical protein